MSATATDLSPAPQHLGTCPNCNRTYLLGTACGADDHVAGTKTAGKHADVRVSYMDAWAKRYWRSQYGIERSRLRKGKAKHRAHRDELPIKAPNGDDS